MKALSINQPWAWLIVNGFKAIENRDWDTRYRGEFLIHAGKKIDWDAYEFLAGRDIAPPHAAILLTGGIIGKARLIATVHIRDKHLLAVKDQPWFFGKYGFVLDSAIACDFMPCKGALGFFTPDFSSRYAEPKLKTEKAGNGAGAITDAAHPDLFDLAPSNFDQALCKSPSSGGQDAAG